MADLSRIGVAVLLTAVSMSACRAEGLAFREDKRLRILAPADRALVTLPVTVRWAVEDFEVAPPDGSEHPGVGHFGVFVDRAPQAPGRTIASLADDDESCQVTPGCPDERWFADRGVYRTTETEIRFDFLPDLRPSGRDTIKDPHEVTIVLLNGKGERIGESAFAREFFVKRPEE